MKKPLKQRFIFQFFYILQPELAFWETELR